MEGRQKRVALYARASSSVQEHSNPGQLRDLREGLPPGRRVVAEIQDLGEKRHDLTRPGLDRVRDLAEADEIDEVWSWAWDRYGSFPVPEVLAVELRDYGVELRSLDDNGGGEDGEDMQVIKSLFSRREQRDRVRRANRGRRDKALRGAVFGGFRQRYGFRFVQGRNKNGQEVNVGYEVDPEKIEHVRRIFEMVANGESLHAIQREFEQTGVPNPSGGPQWSRTTIKGIVRDDVYRPHGREELEELVPDTVLSRTSPEKVYGIHWSGRKRSRFKNSRSKQRVVYETPPEEWTAVPVDLTGSGLDRGVVDRARAAIKDNRSPSKAGDRSWELSGVLFCGECGRRMISYRRAKKSGHNHYYRCRPGSTLAECSNRRSHPAGMIEYHALGLFEHYIDEGELLSLYDQAVEERDRRSGRCASPKRRAALVERSEVLARMRRSFQDQQAEGLMTLTELRERLAKLDEEREEITAQLRATEQAAGERRESQAARGLIEQLVRQGQSYLLKSPEQIRKDYRRVGARFEVDAEGTLTLRLALDLSTDALQTAHTY